MLVEGSLSYDELGEDPEWASCSHFLCIWNLEPNDSKCKAKHDLRRRGHLQKCDVFRSSLKILWKRSQTKEDIQKFFKDSKQLGDVKDSEAL